MRKRTFISLFLMVVMILTASGIASAQDSWEYYFPITVSETSGVARTAYPIILEVGGQSLVDGGYLTANGTDARLRTTTDKNLLMSTTNITFTVDTLPAYGQVTYNLYTGYSPEIGYFPTIVGDGGYVTVEDEPSIELGDNFTIEQSGWVNTVGETLTWSSPTSYNDPSSAWTSENLTYDDDTATKADSYISAGTWSGYLELNIIAGSYNRIRYYATRGSAFIDLIDIDYYSDGAWQDLYQGTPVLGEWETLTFIRTIVTAARVRFHCVTTAEEAWLHELDFGSVGGSLVSKTGALEVDAISGNITARIFGASANVTTSVTSGEHTIKTSGSPIFLGIGEDIDTNTGFPTVSDNTEFIAPLWSSYLSGSPFVSVDATAQTCTATGTVWSNETGRYFDGVDDKISVPNASFADDTKGSMVMWIKYFDNATRYTAFSTNTDGVWEDHFWLDYWGSSTNYLRFSLDVNAANILQLTSPNNAIADTDWHMVVLKSDGSTVSLSVDTVPQALTVTVGANTGQWFADAPDADNMTLGGIQQASLVVDLKGDIGEVLIYNEALSSAEETTLYNDTKWKYIGSYTDDNFEYVYSGVSVPDTTDNWTFLQNNVMPYADNITITVDGTRELWFEPNAMITGATLPDRATSVANDGTITWGSNDGVEIVFGSVTSYEATTSAASVNETGFVLPLVGIPDNWWGMEFDGEGLPFYPTFLDASTETGIPLQTLYLLLVFGAAIALATVTIVLTRSVVVGVAFYTITMSYGANAGIVAWWIIYVFLIMVVGIIFLSSRQAMGG